MGENMIIKWDTGTAVGCAEQIYDKICKNLLHSNLTKCEEKEIIKTGNWMDDGDGTETEADADAVWPHK